MKFYFKYAKKIWNYKIEGLLAVVVLPFFYPSSNPIPE